MPPTFLGRRSSAQIKIRQEYFTSKTAREFSGRKDVLFVSDIRTADTTKLTESEVEDYVMQDNKAQAEWYRIIQPKKAMLKFRLPFPDRVGGGISTYLDGDVFLPVWGGQTTTETRLVPFGVAERLLSSQLHAALHRPLNPIRRALMGLTGS